MSRNQERVLSDQMISDIKERMFKELNWGDPRYALVSAIVDTYLTNDWDSFKQLVTDAIEHYEDDIITELNTELMEDSFNQAENGN